MGKSTLSASRSSGVHKGPTTLAVSTLNSEVFFINASKAGVFIPILEHNVSVLRGEKLGEIIDPLLGVVQETIISPCNGLLFTIR
ncbi:MAG TPA: hypothetical protein PK034_10530, partial [Rugosibacter sp.]|nr:hypothetical protein [Rugosibacter sp.]